MSDPIDMPGGTFAANVRAARAARGLTLVELAERSGLDPSAVSRWETGKREPGLSSIVALAGGLGMTASDLLEGLKYRP